MSFLKIKGGKALTGSVNVSGSKNSSLCIIAACLLFNGKIVVHNVPDIVDVRIMFDIFKMLKVNYTYLDNTFTYFGDKLISSDCVDECIKRIRGSYYFMGALLGRYKRVLINYPGGCQIGKRPIDYHFMAFESLGASLSFYDDEVLIKVDEFNSCIIEFENQSLGATVNAILASTYAVKTTLINASIEPEVMDLIAFLKGIGVLINVVGNTIVIDGKTEVIKTNYTYKVMYDRIEAGTFIALGLIKGPIFIGNIDYRHLKKVVYDLIKANAKIDIRENMLVVYPSKLESLEIDTFPYPLFPTDLQQIFSPVLAIHGGRIKENIFENRISTALELKKMGAIVETKEREAIYQPSTLTGCYVEGHDLRGSMALLIAGLIANGDTILKGYEFIERGYEDIYNKIRMLGGEIEFVKCK